MRRSELGHRNAKLVPIVDNEAVLLPLGWPHRSVHLVDRLAKLNAITPWHHAVEAGQRAAERRAAGYWAWAVCARLLLFCRAGRYCAAGRRDWRVLATVLATVRRLSSPKMRRDLRSPHSPIGRGSGLKIRQVSVRVRLGARHSRW